MKRILIIDDEPQVRSLLKKMLEREGFNVVIASDGKKGMDLFNKEPADLVITDILMPNMEGTEVIRELKKSFLHLPIIAISGGGQVPAKTHLNSIKPFGVNAVFEKPIKKKEFLNEVRKVLNI